MDLNKWCDVMANPTTGVDELTIFALSKIYQRHTVIFNSSKPWTTLEPNGEMGEEQLFENCQIHLAYVGKDLFATLHRKPFIEQAAPQTLKNMLEPMKIRRNTRRSSQNEPMDLSLPSKSPDNSMDLCTSGNDSMLHCEGNMEPDPDPLGDNVDALVNNITPVAPEVETREITKCDKYEMALEAIRKTWMEVKLLQMESCDLEFYLNKTDRPKGDNDEPKTLDSPVLHSWSGRPIKHIPVETLKELNN